MVFELGPKYDYAFVAGNNRDYLWLLARTPNPPQSLKDRFVARSAELGFASDDLIWVSHPRSATN